MRPVTTKSKKLVHPVLTRIQAQAAVRALCEVIRKSPKGSAIAAVMSAKDAIWAAMYSNEERAA